MSTLRMGAIALTLAMIGVVYSQDKKPDDKKPDDKKPPVKLKGYLPQNWKKLGLRDDQVQKIYKIRADAKAKADELKAKLDKLKAEEKEQLEKVLTPEQLKRLREIRTGEKPTEK
jgi:Spy/CpxP family protein refolding chaperone